MKKYLILLGIIAVATTGCGKKSNGDSVETIAHNLAIASIKKDNSSISKLGTDLQRMNAKIEEIIIGDNCAEVLYTYKNERNSSRACLEGKKKKSNSENESSSSVDNIAKNLAKASLNNDNDAMVKLGNDMLKYEATPIEIRHRNNCAEVVYSYMGKEKNTEYCQ